MKNIASQELKNRTSILLQQKRMPIYEEELWCNKSRVVYGPVASRRLGESVGINFFPKAKICSFNCCYCDVNVTNPNAFNVEFQSENIIPLDLLKIEIETGVKELLKRGVHIDYVTICGNGEATDYPFFVGAAEFLLNLRSELFPRIPLAILTNSSNIDKIEIRSVFDKYDIVFYKLDAGDENTFNIINRPVRKDISFKNIVEALKSINEVKIQTAVVVSRELSNKKSLMGPYIDIIKDINPEEIYLHNIDYPVPYKQIRRLRHKEIKELGDYIALKTNVPVFILHSLISLRKKR